MMDAAFPTCEASGSGTSTSSPYFFSLLDSEKFRVVRVTPGDWHDPVRCTLIHRDLGEPSKGGPYKALSYVWGSPKVTGTVYLNDFPMTVTLNLLCALKYLRHTTTSGQDLTLWVDALCINQADADERGEQVRLMQQIYANAAEVKVFIGDGLNHRAQRSVLKRRPTTPVQTLFGDERDQDFQRHFMELVGPVTLKDLSSPGTASLSAIGLMQLLSDSDSLKRNFGWLMSLSPTVRRRLFECLRMLIIAPWWNRIWVVQEIAVSRAATVQYGTISVPWPILVRAAKTFSTFPNAYESLESDDKKVFSLVESQVSNIERTRIKWRTDGGNDLVRLLQEFSSRQASDDRDKVYGVLSLAKDGHSIVPDYNLDVFLSYQKVALALMNGSSGLTCWVGDQKRKNHKNLPSWVPDWSTSFEHADRRRMDGLCQNPEVGDVWKLHIIDSEDDYWPAVEEQARLLLESLLKHEPRGRLPASLQSHIKRYIQFLNGRIALLNFRLFDFLEESSRVTILSCLQQCLKSGYILQSGQHLLRSWIKAIAVTKTCSGPLSLAEYEVKRMWVKFVEEIERLCHAPNFDKLDRMQTLLYDLESLYVRCYLNPEELESLNPDSRRHWESLGGLNIKARKIERSIKNLVDVCRQLAALCCTDVDNTSHGGVVLDLFKHSYSFRGKASWMNELQRSSTRFVQYYYTPSDLLSRTPKRSFVSPIRCIELQSGFVDRVNYVGPRMLGWSDMDAALRTLAQWLIKALFPRYWRSRQHQQMFAQTLVGGFCWEQGVRIACPPALLAWVSSFAGNLVWSWDYGPIAETKARCKAPPSPFLENIQQATDGRVFFQTVSGKMGLGPSSMQRGDVLNTFPSGCTRYVLRHVKPPVLHMPRSARQDIAIDGSAFGTGRSIRDHFGHAASFELIGDCYLNVGDMPHTFGHADGTIEGRNHKSDLKGALPYEVLGAAWGQSELVGRAIGTVVLV